MAVAGPLAGKLTGVEKNDAKAWLPAAAESTKVLDLQASFQSSNIFPAVVVYQRLAGITPADRAKAAADARTFAGVRGVAAGQVAGPVVARDAKAMETIVGVNLGKQGWNGAGRAADTLRSIAVAGADGMAVHITGPLGTAADSGKAFKGIDNTLLYATLTVVIVLLLITYRSPVLWLLPVICAGVALTSAQALIYLLAVHAGLTVNAQSAGILYVLVFGAGTDYALLLTARYREELHRHQDRHEAMAEAMRRASPAIIASACTVILSMLTLLVAELNSTKGLGPVLAIGVAVALLAMITLLPALLVICGRWVFWPVRPRYGTAEPTARGVWARIGRNIATAPRLVWVTTAVLLGALALGALGLKASGLTNQESFRNRPDSVAGEATVARHFPAGAGQPVVVIGNAPAGGQLRSAFAATRGVTAVTPPVGRAGHAYLEGTLIAPPDSPAAYATVDRVRAAVHAVPGADAKVGGSTAINLDVMRASAHDRDVIIPLILVVVLAILVLLLRAVVAPIILVASVVLSFGATMGISALAFNHLFRFGGADTSFPLFVFVFLVALGIDYNIFLMTRVREEAGRRGARRGALIGLAATGGVITSAGAVLAGTFAVLGTLSITFLTELGFAVAVGVLLDTIIVRSVLVTALNLDIGRAMWWPGAIARKPDPAPADMDQRGAHARLGPDAGRLASENLARCATSQRAMVLNGLGCSRSSCTCDSACEVLTRASWIPQSPGLRRADGRCNPGHTPVDPEGRCMRRKSYGSGHREVVQRRQGLWLHRARRRHRRRLRSPLRHPD
jgi:RND superfamily putative drug exporter